MNYNVMPYELDGGQWIVERRVNNEVERAWFTGPDAEQRAREYADWKNEREEGGMTREEFLKLIDKFDWNAGYQWKYELTYLRDHDQAQREKLARLRKALENFVDQFECDFVLDDGTIVDNPPERWRPIEQCYKLAKSALAKEATRDTE